MATTTPTTRLLDNYVAGRWTSATGDDALDVTNPATGETIGRVPLSASACRKNRSPRIDGTLPSDAWSASRTLSCSSL